MNIMDDVYMEKLIIYLKYKYRLNNDDIEEYIDSFNIINEGNRIDSVSLREFIMDEIIGDPWTKDECKEIIIRINEKINYRSVPTLDLQTYLLYFIPICQEYVVTRIGIREVFNDLDTNSDDKITREEFIEFLYRINRDFSPDELITYKKQIKKMCDDADTNHDKYISYDEFKKFILEMGVGSVTPNPIKASPIKLPTNITPEQNKSLTINLNSLFEHTSKNIDPILPPISTPTTMPTPTSTSTPTTTSTCSLSQIDMPTMRSPRSPRSRRSNEVKSKTKYRHSYPTPTIHKNHDS